MASYSHDQSMDDAPPKTESPNAPGALLEHLVSVIYRVRSAKNAPSGHSVQKVYEKMMKLHLLKNITLKCQSVQGLEWKVPMPALIAQSEALQQKLPDLTNEEKWPKEMSLNYHPQFIDRYKAFILTGSYKLDKGGKALKLYHVDSLPSGLTVTSFPLNDLSYIDFHLNMYSLGEYFRDAGLLEKIREKLIDKLVLQHDSRPAALSAVIDTVYGNAICEDKEGLLKELVLGAVFAHEKAWGKKAKEEFGGLTAGSQGFRPDLEVAKGMHKKTLAPPDPEVAKGMYRQTLPRSDSDLEIYKRFGVPKHHGTATFADLKFVRK